MNALWGQLDCRVGQVYACSVAQLRLWIMRNEQGWQIATRHELVVAFEPLHEVALDGMDVFEWSRFVTPQTASVLHLIPVLPDRPVMSRPETRIEIVPHHKGHFFVTIPVWLRVQISGAGTQHALTLCEFSTRVLSRTWFGHPAEEGEIGYALATRARQSLEELNDVEGRAICPVVVENGTHEPLVFAQLQLRVRHMGIYQTADGKFWTNECRLTYSRSVSTASVSFGRAAPEQAQGARQLSGPREAAATGLTARAIVGAIFRQPY
jgi:hypothetical protein